MTELIAEGWKEYELLDTGDGCRLERFGSHTLVRPDPNVLWQPSDPDNAGWKHPGLRYEGRSHRGSWEGVESLQEGWWISEGTAKFKIVPTPFGHVGLFPEQKPQWEWLTEKIKQIPGKARVLNLFAYTGGASIMAALAGAEVCHVDASKASTYKAKENAAASGLPADAIRWIVDDAVKFMQREVRRGSRYDIIIMDPPVFGRGPKGEIWRLEEQLAELAQLAKQLLAETAPGLLINFYATSLYPGSVLRVFENADLPVKLEAGILSIVEKSSKRSLPTGYFLRG